MSGVLRLEHAAETQRAAIQLHLSALQVRELAEGLTRLAIYLEGAAADAKRKGSTT